MVGVLVGSEVEAKPTIGTANRVLKLVGCNADLDRPVVDRTGERNVVGPVYRLVRAVGVDLVITGRHSILGHFVHDIGQVSTIEKAVLVGPIDAVLIGNVGLCETAHRGVHRLGGSFLG